MEQKFISSMMMNDEKLLHIRKKQNNKIINVMEKIVRIIESILDIRRVKIL
jgi:hypothetical protein